MTPPPVTGSESRSKRPTSGKRAPPLPRTIDVEGATTKEAIAKALKLLGVRRSQVTVKVLAEEERGLFGMKGASLAKIRVTLKPPP